jgi:flavodoxin
MEDKKILIIYYSRTGKTKNAAEKLKEELNCDIEEIYDRTSRKGIFGFLKSGHDAMKGKLTAITGEIKDVSDYETIVICTPIWAGHVSSAIRTYIMLNKDKFKKVTFLSTGAGVNASAVFSDMQEICQLEPITKVLISAKDIKEEKMEKKLIEFASKIKLTNI